MEFSHIPVLLSEVIDGLNLKKNGVYADFTIGGAGHSSKMLSLMPSIKLIGFDQDPSAIEASRERLKDFKNVTLVESNFKDAPKWLEENDIGLLDGALVDLGVSSHQIDSKERGFSFRFDAPLDMRMSDKNPLDAKKVVNTYSEEDLKRIFRDFGEERFASSIAKKIVKEREKSTIQTTKELEKIILSSVPRYRGNDGMSNVQRVFQAIRIEVNHELDGLDKFIRDIVAKLKSGGRMAIISFHSLEDRIVKHTFKELATGCTCPSDFPICVCGKKPSVKIITNHPITASEEELKENRRASSAKLRVIEKL